MNWFEKHESSLITAIAAFVCLFGALPLTQGLEWLIPYFAGLASLGPVVYVSSAIFLTGLAFLMKGDDERAATCMELLPTLGFLGTALGFTRYLQDWDISSQEMDISGLKFAFLATAQGLLFNAILMAVSLAKAQLNKEDS